MLAPRWPSRPQAGRGTQLYSARDRGSDEKGASPPPHLVEEGPDRLLLARPRPENGRAERRLFHLPKPFLHRLRLEWSRARLGSAYGRKMQDAVELSRRRRSETAAARGSTCRQGRSMERWRKIASAPDVLVFDSGLGGLTVLAEIRRAALPDARLVYAADDAAFPYGEPAAKTSSSSASPTVVGRLADEHRPDLVVIACNTASTLCLPTLRASALPLPVVGTVPAIKPAAAATRTGHVAVLGTPGTVQRDYTRALIDTFAGGALVTLVGAQRLARSRRPTSRGMPSRRGDPGRDRALLLRAGGAAHRRRRARLHALPAADRRLSPARALAGRLHRSGAGDSEARGGAARARARSPTQEQRHDALAIFTSGAS